MRRTCGRKEESVFKPVHCAHSARRGQVRLVLRACIGHGNVAKSPVGQLQQGRGRAMNPLWVEEPGGDMDHGMQGAVHSSLWL